MIKTIKSRLGVKVFIFTALLLILCCTATYLFIAWFMPKTYASDIEEMLPLAEELSQELVGYTQENFIDIVLAFEGMLLDDYGGAFTLHLFAEGGAEMDPATMTPLAGKTMADYADIPTTTPYQITLADGGTYTFLFANNSAVVDQMREALGQTLPALAVVVLALSLASAALYSWYITSPIVKFSKVSRRMARLDFSQQCVANRSDEIGVLGGSLNELALRLSAALAELQTANAQLQADIDKERELERQRLDFFAAASHELKTPITIIKGQLQGMLAGVGRYRDRDTYLAQSLEAAGTLETMVQELLTVSRIETPGYACTKTDFDAGALLAARLEAHDDAFAQKGLLLEKEIASACVLHGDAGLLAKVFDNLLSNAWRYSPQGNLVRVRLWDENKRPHITIENTGAHIPEGEIHKLFESFYRVEQSRNRRTGGSGLGLYIVKTILDLHGAAYTIQNTDEGVLFKIQF